MKVLVADDDPVTRRTLAGLLDYLGHEVIEAHDGLQAWDLIHGRDAPDLIILDWMMPEPSGIEICRRLRGSEKRPYQYVLMLTARDSIDDLVEGMEAGADDYLRKPFDVRELRVRVRAAERMLAVQDELRAQAITDELTGLLNRRGIFHRVDNELALVARDGRPLCVLVVDIDNFKTINDTHGHAVGDEVLREVSNRMRRQLRSYDDVGRHGGEEFAVTLPACDPAGARSVAERIRDSICAEPIQTSAGAVAVTVSAGVASADARSGHDTSSLISTADQALYLAKENGRNRVEFA